MTTPEDTTARLLEPLTDDQRTCATTLGRPLVVSAGAGSGKTFMLTRRIAYALLHPEASGVQSIDDVLAVTFTRAAAGEIKARVRSALRSVGLADQALRVDGSWIGTIHSTCGSILREHALELGLDPRFEVLADTESRLMLEDAVNRAVGEVSLERRGAGSDDADERSATADGGGAGGEGDGGDGAGGSDGARPDGPGVVDDAYAALFEAYPSSGSGTGVGAMVRTLLEKAAGCADGLDGIDFGPGPAPARELARSVAEAMSDVLGKAELSPSYKWSEKVTGAVQDQRTGISAFERLAASDATTHEDLARALCAFSPKFGAAPKKVAAAVAANASLRRAYADACTQCMGGLATEARKQLMRLARRAKKLYDQAKADAGVLDNDDLLHRTLDALRDNTCGIRNQYRDRFKMVLVDEFQDTSDLQVQILSYLDGSDHERICTVGDAQQSIYRFRGADVDVYLGFKRDVAERGGALAQLDVNWRSHGDIITFVNEFFARPDVFGGPDSEFISLGFDEGHEVDNPFPADEPRVDVELVTSRPGVRARKGEPGLPGVSGPERTRALAGMVADRLCQLHGPDGGPNRSWGDMVILMNAMTNAGTFASALRERGVPCTIAGGSVLLRTPEAQAVFQLARSIANPYDDEAMEALLAGPAFSLSLDEMLGLATGPDGGRRGYWAGIGAALGALGTPEAGGGRRGARVGAGGEKGGMAGSGAEFDGEGDAVAGCGGNAGANAEGGAVPPRVSLAARTIAAAVRRSGRELPSQVLTEALVSSGWLRRLQGDGEQPDPESLATAANILKVVRMVRDAEKGHGSMAEAAARLAADFDRGAGISPGTLNTAGDNAVRIMTTHASKGLEYPVVVLADFCGGRGRPESLTAETVGGRVYVTLGPTEACSDAGDFGKLREHAKELADWTTKTGDDPCPEIARAKDAEIAQAKDAASFAAAVQAAHRDGEGAELLRKFYVGATRPREMLVLAMAQEERSESSVEKDGGTLYTNAVVERLRLMLSPSVDFATSEPGEGYRFGGSRPARCAHRRLARDADGVTMVRDADLGDGERGDVPLDEFLQGQAQASRAALGLEPTDEEDEPGDRGATVDVVEYVDARDLLPHVQPCDPLRAGSFSYTSIARAAGDTGEGGPGVEVDPDEPLPARPRGTGGGWLDPVTDGNVGQNQPEATRVEIPVATGGAADGTVSATDATDGTTDATDAPTSRLTWESPTAFGSALHAACQWMAETRAPGSRGVPSAPDDARLAALARTWGVRSAALPRLRAAVDRWAASDVAREAYALPHAQAEAPLLAHLAGPSGEPLYLEGSIDLLCFDPGPSAGGQHALVVDYKTGGTPAETPDQLREKHLLQARCYAYAVLRAGFQGVDLRFVRVEQEDPDAHGQPQVVRYSFEASQLEELATAIRHAYARGAD